MPGRDLAEIYFITAMMILIVILCVASVVIFFKTYKKEMREKEARLAKKKVEQESGIKD